MDWEEEVMRDARLVVPVSESEKMQVKEESVRRRESMAVVVRDALRAAGVVIS